MTSDTDGTSAAEKRRTQAREAARIKRQDPAYRALMADRQREYMARKKANAAPEQLEAMAERQRGYNQTHYYKDLDRAREQCRERAKRVDPEKRRENNRRAYAKHGERRNAESRAERAALKAANPPPPRKTTPPDPEKQKAWRTSWKAKNPAYHRDWCKRQYEENPQYVLKCRLRGRLQTVLRRGGARKTKQTMELVGCSGAELRDHIAAQFLPGMSWDNMREWHIDHIRPVCTFDLSDPQQQSRCFHYSNLRPLWAQDNLARPRRNYRHTEDQPPA